MVNTLNWSNRDSVLAVKRFQSNERWGTFRGGYTAELARRPVSPSFRSGLGVALLSGPHPYPGTPVPWPLSGGLQGSRVFEWPGCYSDESVEGLGGKESASVPFPCLFHSAPWSTDHFQNFCFLVVTSSPFFQAQSCVVSKVKNKDQS